MAKRQLNNILIDATNNIIAKYGDSIIGEGRFVNILADLYPDRDNSAVLTIIKSAVKDGHITGIQNMGKNQIQNGVSKIVSILSAKYGYNKSLTEEVLYSLAIGMGILSTSEYNKIVSSHPNQQHNQNKKQQHKPQKQNCQQKTRQNDISIEYFFLLLLCFVVLFFSPALYLVCTHNKWWPFFTIILIAFIHFVTIIGTSIKIDDARWSSSPRPIVGGIFLGILICTCLFWILCPFFLGSDFLEFQISYYGFRSSYESPSIISFLMCLFCAFCSCVFIPGVIEFSGIKFSAQNSIINELRVNKSFRNGILFTCLFFLLTGFIGVTIPILSQMHKNHLIDEFNIKIDTINSEKERIKAERSKSSQALSFMDFKLGTSIDSCMNNILRNDNYHATSKKDSYNRSAGLAIKDTDYSTIIDSTIYISSIWDNNTVVIGLHSIKKSLVGISFSTALDIDSLANMFTRKYGEPEFKLEHIEKGGYTYYRYYFEDFDDYLKHYLKPSQYYWTFSNGLIQISDQVSMTSYERGVIYFDRRCEKLMKDKETEEKRIKQAREKHVADSIRHVEELKRKELEENRIRQEKNHKESLEKI